MGVIGSIKRTEVLNQPPDFPIKNNESVEIAKPNVKEVNSRIAGLMGRHRLPVHSSANPKVYENDFLERDKNLYANQLEFEVQHQVSPDLAAREEKIPPPWDKMEVISEGRSRFREIAVKQPQALEERPEETLSEKLSLFGRIKKAVKGLWEVSEKSNEVAGSAVKTGANVAGAEGHEAISQSSIKVFDAIKEKLDKGFLISELIAVPFFLTSAVSYVCQLKGAIQHKWQYSQLEKEINRMEKDQASKKEDILAKKAELVVLKGKLKTDKEVIPKTFMIASYLMKSVKTTSELIAFLAPKGAKLSPHALNTLAVAATILMPIAVGISIGVGTYKTYKSIREYRKIDKKVHKVEEKFENLSQLSMKKRPEMSLGDKNGLFKFLDLQGKKLKMEQNKLTEKKRLATLEIASNSLLMGSGVISLGSMFAGPAAPFLLAGSLTLLSVSGGIEVYKYFSHKKNEKIMEQNHQQLYRRGQVDYTHEIAKVANLAIRSPEIREEVFDVLEVSEEKRAELGDNPEKIFEFFNDHFRDLKHKEA